MKLKLIKLTEKYKDALCEMIDEWREDQIKNNTDRSPGVIFKNDPRNFDYYVGHLDLKVETGRYVPGSAFFLLDEERDRLLGAVHIRHYLNEELRYSGGHIGELTTMTLVPQVADAVDLPVIAAGGIAGGRQMAAAEILGASGVQIGTILLASEECPIHQNYKDALIRAKDNDTVVTGRTVGAPVRILKNPMAREYLRKERAGAEKMELEAFTLGSLRKAVMEGDVRNGSLMAGQVASQIKEIRPVREILEQLEKEYEEIAG